jgi:hypothetical protein
MEILRLVSSRDNSEGNSLTSQLYLWPSQCDLIVVAGCADVALFRQNDAYPLTANVVLDVLRVFSGCVLLNQPPEHCRCGWAGHSVSMQGVPDIISVGLSCRSSVLHQPAQCLEVASRD